MENEICLTNTKNGSRYLALPIYTRGEEIANMITHTIGGAFALASLLLCVGYGAWHKNAAAVVSGMIYGISMILVYVISSVYHGLNPEKSQKSKMILRVLDHCDIYGLIVGSFAPIALTGMCKANPKVAWISFSIVTVTSIVGIIFTAIDFSKFRVISYGAYFVAGWSVLMTVKIMYQTYGANFLTLLISGGVVYTLGMIFYGLQRKNVKYAHSIFHLFILGGSIIQFIAIFKYCI